MSDLTSSANWREVLAWFDRWLDADVDTRPALLAQLEREQPALLPRLRAMIAADRAADEKDFMEDGAFALAFTGGVAEPAAPNRAGLRLGPWELVEAIGSGGMGDVWLATRSDGMHSGRAAVKLLRTARAGSPAEARFQREGELLARLAHPRIAQLLDAGIAADGSRYLVLEHVQGERLDTWCDARTLDTAARLQLMLQVCDAVAYAHTQLVVHRDLKPANILVTAAGDVKLLDFGVAKLLDDDDDAELTHAGSAGLTPEYAAPEQVTGAPISTATDVYALGVLLFGLLTGLRPYELTARNAASLARAIVEQEPLTLDAALARAEVNDAAQAGAAAALRTTTPRGLRQALRGDLETIVSKALKKAPAERYATVQALAADLRNHLAHQPVSAQPDTFGYRSRKFVQRNRMQVAALALVVLSLVAGVAATTWQWRAAVQEGERTRRVVKVLTDLFSGLNPEESGQAQVPVVELLRRGWREAQQKLAGDERLRAEVARPIGLLFSYSGDMPAAVEALTQHRQQLLREARGGGADYLEVTHVLGLAERRLGRQARARELFSEVIAKGAAEPGDAVAWALESQIQIGEMAIDDGQLDEARRWLEPASEMARNRLGEHHRAHTDALEILAGVARQQGRWEDSRHLFSAVTRAAGSNNPHVATQARFSAATLEVETGRYVTAVPLLETALNDFTIMFGAHDTRTIYARAWLATALFRTGEWDRSQEMIDTAYQAASASPELEVRNIIALLGASLQLRRGMVDAAAATLPERLAYFEGAGNNLRRYAARSRLLIGECMMRRGQVASALTVMNQALELQRSLFGPRHPEIVQSLLMIALANDHRGDLKQALVHYDQAQALALAVLPEGHPDRELIRSLASHAHWRQAPSATSLREAQASLESWKVSLHPRSWPPQLSVLMIEWFNATEGRRFSAEAVYMLLSV